MDKKTYREYIRPVLVLVIICFVVTLALSLTYGITAPRIAAREKADAEAARRELLPDAESFEEVNGDLVSVGSGKAKVTECYQASGDSGIVATVDTKSFGGTLTMMVGINGEGKVTGVVISSHSDTPGVGTRDMTDEYLGQYKGISELHDTNVKSDDQIDYISGASVTGEAIHLGVDAALKQYEETVK